MEKILLDHGSGGKASHRLISDTIFRYFQNPILAAMDDSASLEIDGCKLAFSTDSYTVDPIFFPGGDIGELAINGTVNDLAMMGATPLYLSVGFIIQEGFPVADLEKILDSMSTAAQKANVQIVTGDTKVVPLNAADKIFINTSGIGVIPDGIEINGRNARPGDKIIISGTIADHGITVLTQREGLTFESSLQSDTAGLNHLVSELLVFRKKIHVLRDPTRGGLGTTLNEIARQSNVGIVIEEDKIPLTDAVSGACELLGLDPLYLANEGKMIAIVAGEIADEALALVSKNALGKNAAIIGKVIEKNPGRVVLETSIGGRRIVDMLTGEQLPRIC
ncbi:MAG: hydrogenase expression/formation protein HypE [Calditrichaeota bacterium]|nr:hydrogenase expression/formation protein HypE [Calditrichota bacterium]